jgi:hypothetical protein
VEYGEFQGREMWGGSGKIPFQVKKKRKVIFKVLKESFFPIHISGFWNLEFELTSYSNNIKACNSLYIEDLQ